RVADIALDAPTIGDFESLFPLRTDAQLLEHPARDPRKLASCIDQRLRKGPARAAQLPILDRDGRAEDSHVVHGKSFVVVLATNLLQAGPSLRPLARASLRMTCLGVVCKRGIGKEAESRSFFFSFCEKAARHVILSAA